MTLVEEKPKKSANDFKSQICQASTKIARRKTLKEDDFDKACLEIFWSIVFWGTGLKADLHGRHSMPKDLIETTLSLKTQKILGLRHPRYS